MIRGTGARDSNGQAHRWVHVLVRIHPLANQAGRVDPGFPIAAPATKRALPSGAPGKGCGNRGGDLGQAIPQTYEIVHAMTRGARAIHPRGAGWWIQLRPHSGREPGARSLPDRHGAVSNVRIRRSEVSMDRRAQGMRETGVMNGTHANVASHGGPEGHAGGDNRVHGERHLVLLYPGECGRGGRMKMLKRKGGAPPHGGAQRCQKGGHVLMQHRAGHAPPIPGESSRIGRLRLPTG